MSTRINSPTNDKTSVQNGTSQVVGVSSVPNPVLPDVVPPTKSSDTLPHSVKSPLSTDKSPDMHCYEHVPSVADGVLPKEPGSRHVEDSSHRADHILPSSNVSTTEKTNTPPTPQLNSAARAEFSDSHFSSADAAGSRPVPKGELGYCDGKTQIPGPRQKLRPWLIDQINSGEIPGLVWTDKENMIFKIPWKHFGKPGIDTYVDALLFRRWALHTKKFEKDQPEDISVWKTRFRCALHKLPDITELNDQKETVGDEPYRVYKFKKIEIEKIPQDVDGSSDTGPADDESIGSIGSPISVSYPAENATAFTSEEKYNISHTSTTGGSKPTHVTPGSFSDPQPIDDENLRYYPRRYLERPKPTSTNALDIQNWQIYNHMRAPGSYQRENIMMNEHMNYDNEKYVVSSKGRRALHGAENYPPGNKYRAMDHETYEDELSWRSRSSLPNNRSAYCSSSSTLPKYSSYYNPASAKGEGFQPFDRSFNRGIDNNFVPQNVNPTQNRSEPEIKEEDDNELFFQSCAKRIKKLNSKTSGYLKLKILEQFFYVENMSEKERDSNLRSSHGCTTEPPPLINTTNNKKYD